MELSILVQNKNYSCWLTPIWSCCCMKLSKIHHILCCEIIIPIKWLLVRSHGSGIIFCALKLVEADQVTFEKKARRTQINFEGGSRQSVSCFFKKPTYVELWLEGRGGWEQEEKPLCSSCKCLKPSKKRERFLVALGQYEAVLVGTWWVV